MKKKFLLAVEIVLGAGVFLGCETNITGSIENSGRAVLNVNSVFMTNTNALIKKLGGFSNAEGAVDVPIIDADELNKSLTGSGIEKASFKNVAGNTAALSGEITISKIDDLIKDREFIKFEKRSSGSASGGKATFYIDRKNGPGVLESISPELVAYLQVLMAPIADGNETDITDKKNYLENITMVWGAAVAKEINSSYITLNLKFPEAVTTISSGGKSIGKIDGNKAVIKIPLIDLLVLEVPVSYEIIWGK
jgi:hypothetical protein